MRRRVLLAGIATGGSLGVAGCLGASADDPETDRALVLYEVDVAVTTFESDYPLASTASVVSHATEDTPARVEIGLTNTGDETLDLTLGATPPFSEHATERVGGNAIAHLAPDSRRNFGLVHVDDDLGPGENPSAPVDGCWVVEGSGTDYVGSGHQLAPGAELTETYSVFANADNDGCLPAGTYRFEESTDGTSRWVIDLVVAERTDP